MEELIDHLAEDAIPTNEPTQRSVGQGKAGLPMAKDTLVARMTPMDSEFRYLISSWWDVTVSEGLRDGSCWRRHITGSLLHTL